MKCIIPGSFDPVNLGHLDIVKRASELFDEVWAVIFVNSGKHTAFTEQLRLKMLTAACSDIKNVRTTVSNEMLVDFMRKKEIKYLVKGVRNSVDFEYENMLASINRSFYPESETLLLISRSELQHISSTAVRELIKYGKSTDGYMPKQSIDIMKNEDKLHL